MCAVTTFVRKVQLLIVYVLLDWLPRNRILVLFRKKTSSKRHKHYKGNGEEKDQRLLTATTRRVIRTITWQPCWKGIPYAPAEDALSFYGLLLFFFFFLYHRFHLVNILLHFYFRVQVPLKYPCEILFWISREILKTIILRS